MVRKAITVYLEADTWHKLVTLAREKLGKTGSQRLDELIAGEVAKLEGHEAPPTQSADYEQLKTLHYKLVKEVDLIERRLTKRKVYDELVGFAGQKGLNLETLANLEDTMPKMLSEWNGLPEDMHQFITLLETVKRKRQVEKKIAEIRKQNAQAMLLHGS